MRLSTDWSLQNNPLSVVKPQAAKSVTSIQTPTDRFRRNQPVFGMAVAVPEGQDYSHLHRSVVDAALLLAASYGAKLPQTNIFRKQMSLIIYDEAMQAEIAKHAFRGVPDTTIFRIPTKRDDRFSMTIGYVPPKDGKPVILISPDAGGRIDDMRPFILALIEKGYGVMAYQYAITGQAGKTIYDNVSPEKAYSPEEFLAEDANTLSEWLNTPNLDGIVVLSGDKSKIKQIEAIPYDRQILAGPSIGGQVSALIAKHNSERAYRVVAIGSPASMGDFADSWTGTESHKRVRNRLHNSKNVRAAIAELKRWFSMEVLSDVWQPVLILSGDQDHATPNMQELASTIQRGGRSNIQTAPIHGADHNNILNDDLSEPTRGKELSRDVDNKLQRNPQQVVDAIEAFIDQTSSD